MQDTEVSKPRKTAEKKKYPWTINMLKEYVRAMTITKCILDLGVNLTICNLLVLALAIQKQLIKAITEDETV